MKLYEGMFLLDNQAVRADWRKAKALVTDTLEKHGARVATVRRWDERKLAYPMRGRQRGTYLLSYYELDAGGIDGLRRDLELSETVLRYMLLRAEEVPETERALSAAELDAAFEIPLPPEDDSAEPESAAVSAEATEEDEVDGAEDDADDTDDDGKEDN